MGVEAFAGRMLVARRRRWCRGGWSGETAGGQRPATPVEHRRVVGRPPDGDQPPVVQTMVVRTDQQEVRTARWGRRLPSARCGGHADRRWPNNPAPRSTHPHGAPMPGAGGGGSPGSRGRHRSACRHVRTRSRPWHHSPGSGARPRTRPGRRAARPTGTRHRGARSPWCDARAAADALRHRGCADTSARTHPPTSGTAPAPHRVRRRPSGASTRSPTRRSATASAASHSAPSSLDNRTRHNHSSRSFQYADTSFSGGSSGDGSGSSGAGSGLGAARNARRSWDTDAVLASSA